MSHGWLPEVSLPVALAPLMQEPSLPRAVFHSLLVDNGTCQPAIPKLSVLVEEVGAVS